MPLLEKQQRTDAWLDARRGRITASLAAACLGLDPYTSRAAAWRSILGREVKKENRHMRWGTEFEPMARRWYECETGNIVTETGFWVHPTLDWLGASPDGLIGDDGLLEIKVPGKVPEEIPLHHQVQMTVQMVVTGRLWCDYCAWTHDEKYLFTYDLYKPDCRDWLIKLEDFYRKYIVTEIEPPRFRSGEKKQLTGAA